MRHRLNHFIATLRRFGADTRGVTAIEFAFIAPVFFAIVGIILEVALLLFIEYAIQGGVQNTSRAIRTGHAQEKAWNAAKFREEVCKFAIIVNDCTTDLRVYVRSAASFTTLGTTVPALTTINAAGAIPFQCGASLDSVVVIAFYDYDFVMPTMKYFGNMNTSGIRRIGGYSLFRNEPFPATTACT